MPSLKVVNGFDDDDSGNPSDTNENTFEYYYKNVIVQHEPHTSKHKLLEIFFIKMLIVTVFPCVCL